MNIYTKAQPWQIFQQKNCYADIHHLSEPQDWIKNPLLDEEIKMSERFLRLEAMVIDETTGECVVPWVKGEKTDDFQYTFEIKNVPVGGPYIIQRRAVFRNDNGGEDAWGASNEVCHIGVGDVFLITGQSNAQGYARGMFTEELQLGVSCFKSDNTWDIASQPLSGNGYSMYLNFAKLLNKKLGYPVGIIPRAVGGSAIKAWLKDGIHTKRIVKEKNEFGLDIRAILWYQGCTDTTVGNNRDDYRECFIEYVSYMREVFDNDKLPVFTFQINRVWNDSEYDDYGWDCIREIQRTMPKHIDNVYVLPTIDAWMMSDAIHNSRASNMLLSERLYYQVLDKLYNKTQAAEAPDISEARMADRNTVELIFKNVIGKIEVFGATAENLPFCVTDDDGVAEICEYEIKHNIISLKLIRPLCKNAKVKGFYGTHPSRIMIDYETQLPIFPFSNVEIKNS